MTSLRSRVLCIHLPFNEEASIGRSLSHTYTNNGSHSHTWNYEDHAFDYQLYQWGVDKLFPNEYEAITRELKMYIEEWEK